MKFLDKIQEQKYFRWCLKHYMPAEYRKYEASVCDVTHNGVLIGIAIGDMSGMPYEYFGIGKKDISEIELCEGSYTDDTMMAIAIRDAAFEIKKNHIRGGRCSDVYADYMKRYAKKYPGLSYGPAFYNWAVKDIPMPFKSYGNGSAMRVGAIGVMFDTAAEVIRQAYYSAVTTHGDAIGICGAIVTAVCVFMASRGATKDELLQYAQQTLDEELYQKYICHTPEELHNLTSYETASLVCDISVCEAICNFIHSDDTESCIRNSFRYWCDTDTVGAISGSIAAAFYKDAHKYLRYQEQFPEELLEAGS